MKFAVMSIDKNVEGEVVVIAKYNCPAGVFVWTVLGQLISVRKYDESAPDETSRAFIVIYPMSLYNIYYTTNKSNITMTTTRPWHLSGPQFWFLILYGRPSAVSVLPVMSRLFEVKRTHSSYRTLLISTNWFSLYRIWSLWPVNGDPTTQKPVLRRQNSW